MIPCNLTEFLQEAYSVGKHSDKKFTPEVSYQEVWRRVAKMVSILDRSKKYRVKSKWTPDLVIILLSCLISNITLIIDVDSSHIGTYFSEDFVTEFKGSDDDNDMPDLFQLTSHQKDNQKDNQEALIIGEQQYPYQEIIYSVIQLQKYAASIFSHTQICFGRQGDIISEIVVLLTSVLVHQLTLVPKQCSKTLYIYSFGGSDSKSFRPNGEILHLFQRTQRIHWTIPSVPEKALLFNGCRTVARGKTHRGRLCVVHAFPSKDLVLHIHHQPRLRTRDAIRYEPFLHHHHLSRQEFYQETSVDLPLSSLSVILSALLIVSKQYPILLHSYTHQKRLKYPRTNWLCIREIKSQARIQPLNGHLSRITILIDRTKHTCQILCCYNLVIGHLFPLLEKIRRQMVDLVLEGTDRVTEETRLPTLDTSSYKINPWVILYIVKSYLKLALLRCSYYFEQYEEEAQVCQVDCFFPKTSAQECIAILSNCCTYLDESLPIIVWEAKKYPVVYIQGTPQGDSSSAFLFLLLSYIVRNRFPSNLIQDLIIHAGVVTTCDSNPWLKDVQLHRSEECYSRQKITIQVDHTGSRIYGTMIRSIAKHLSEYTVS